MDGIQLNVTGAGDAIRRINAYSLQLGDKVVMSALRAGGALLKKQIQTQVHTESGRLKRSIRVFTSKINKRNKNSKIGLFVRPYTGKKKDDPRGAYYAYMVENGYEVRGRNTGTSPRRLGATGLVSGRKTQASGKFVMGRQFVKNGFTASRSSVERLISQSVEQGSAQLAARLDL
jgi:hypothetical protein